MHTTHTKNIANQKKSPRSRIGTTIAVLVTSISISGAAHTAFAATPTTTPSAASQKYQRELKGQVDTDVGAPRSGRDPANQSQNSLISAASTPSGVGQRVDKPAAGVVGVHKHLDPASVLPDTKNTRVSSGGCLLDYGKAGAECLPARAAGDQPINCDFIHKIFPGGVKITGLDTMKLNSGNNIACAK